jgi:hypothetical protein
LRLAVELVDQAQAGLDHCLPRLRQSEPREQLAAAEAEQVESGQGLPWVSRSACTRCFKLER